MVFTAMATDYFPRLAGVIHEDSKWKKLVNEQAELVLIILGIVLIFLLSTTPLLIRVLLSKEFMASQNFIQFAILAIPLKGLVWVIGYVILAKGNNILFITVDIIANLIVLGLNMFFYHYYGLTGLGISLSLSYLISFTFMVIILKNKYDFKFSFGVFKLMSLSVLSLVLCLLCIQFLEKPYLYLAELLIVLITVAYFLYELNIRVSFKSILLKLKKR